MNREEYLNDSQVSDFIEWMRLRVSGEEAFSHSYRMRRSKKSWNCGSLWEAFEKYEFRGRDFETNERELGPQRIQIQCAVSNQDNSKFVCAAKGILKWGGVTRGNVSRLNKLGDNALCTFYESAEFLKPSSADTLQLGNIRYMNSGWTKVYSLMLDGFPIYDGRVGAAMGYLVKKYCEEKRLRFVPDLLHFRWGEGKSGVNGPNRNPSSGSIQFKKLRHAPSGIRKWVECNVWAAWILGEMKDEGKFDCLKPHLRLRSLEAALFMVGYEIPGQA